MEKKQSNLSYILVAAVSVLLTLMLVFVSLCAFAGGFDNLKRGAKLTQILHVVKDEFVAEADMDAAADLAAAGIIQSLNDKWSYYMTADEYAQRRMQTANSYRGIGVTITACAEGFLVSGVTQDTPAYKAGILPGEKLIAINGESMAGWEASQIQEKIQSFDHESFEMSVMDEKGAVRELTLSTQTVYTSPVSYEKIDDTGYIILKNFSSGCAEDAISAIEALTEQGVSSLVFDVRYNGGGFVHELTALLDYLLPEGDIFVARDRDGNETVTSSDAQCISLPMAVIVNDDSYSAAELFAAQLSEFGAAVTVGQPTTGKGRSQVSFMLFDGSAVHISQEAYLTSQRRDLAQQGGLVPDVQVMLSDEDEAMLYYRNLPYAEDEQLTAALDVLK